MSREFFDRCGRNPTEVHARFYGRKPGGIIVVTAEQRERAEREARRERAEREAEERERAEREAEERERSEREAQERGRAEAPPGGCVPPPPPLPVGESVEAEASAAESPIAAAPSPSPSEAGADMEDEPTRVIATPGLKDWLASNWERLTALDAAGELPELGLPAPAEPPPPPPPLPPIHVAKGDRWNKHKMACFLRELAATQNVSKAAKSVGMSRESAHRLRNRLKGQPFDVAWEAASRHGYDALVDGALGRATNGVEVPHYYQGEEVGSHIKFDERLTVALLKMRNDEGAPTIGRYGAAAEWMTERWDAALARIETGSVDWSDERRALNEAELAALDLPDEKAQIDALIQKHLPGQGPRSPSRK